MRQRADKFSPPIELYRVTAKLIKAGLFSIDDIFQYLQPDIKLLKTQYVMRMELAFELYKDKKYIGNDESKRNNEKENRIKSIKTIFAQAMNNQVLWMLEALILENAWGDAQTVIVAIG